MYDLNLQLIGTANGERNVRPKGTNLFHIKGLIIPVTIDCSITVTLCFTILVESYEYVTMELFNKQL